VPATCPYPEPARSSPYPHITLPEDPSLYYPPICAWVFQMVSIPQVSPPQPRTRRSFAPLRATCPAHPILLDLITQKILVEQYRPLSSSLCSFLHSCYLVPLRCQYSPQPSILKYPQPTFLPQCETKFHTHTKQQFCVS